MNFKFLSIRFSIIIVILAAVLAGGLIFIQSAAAAQGVVDGLKLCTNVIIPSLFMFMVLCIFIVRSGIARSLGVILEPIIQFFFHLPGNAGSALIMSFVGGYPIGARSTYELYRSGALTKEQAGRLILIAVNAGPAFIVVAVGEGMIGNRDAGMLLLCVHILASLILGIGSGFVWRYKDKRENLTKGSPIKPAAGTKPQQAKQTISNTFQRFINDFVDSTAAAARGTFHICSFVILFSGILGLISSLHLNPHIKLYLSCILEATTGSAGAVKTGSLPLVAAVLGFSGISVICQVTTASKEVMPNLPLFLLYRVLHALLSVLLILPFKYLFPISAQVFSSGTNVLAPAHSASMPASVALIVMCIVLLSNLNRKRVDTDK